MTVPYVFVPRNFNNMRRANGFGDVSRRRHHNANAAIAGGDDLISFEISLKAPLLYGN